MGDEETAARSPERVPVLGAEERAPTPPRPAPGRRRASHTVEPPAVPEGTFVKVRPQDHPLSGAAEVTVYFQDYHRSRSKLGRFGKAVGIDEAGGEYLVMLDNFECVSAPMRRVEWRKIAT